MRSSKATRLMTMALGCLAFLATACVDAPTAANDPLAATSNQLATSFDALAEEQDEAGDVERGEEFRWASLALRLGVTPALFEVKNDGASEVYSAFVHEARWTLPVLAMRPASHRAFIAWRKTEDKMQVILISMSVDSAPVLHPFSMRPAAPGDLQSTSPVAAAQAGYFERSANGSAWIGIGGIAKIAEQSVTDACHAPNANDRPKGITCQLARFAVLFNINFAKTREKDSRIVELNANTRRIIAAQQLVPGVKLTFNCISPAATVGCGSN